MTNLPPDLDSTDLAILMAITNRQDISTSQIESIVYLSRAQTLRRLKQLEDANLIVRKDGVPGQTYRYELGPGITPEDVQQANLRRLSTNRDPVSRECLLILVQGMQAIADQIAEISGRIEGILK
jgi:DNA-binding Lrp family transcriptional regulator